MSITKAVEMRMSTTTGQVFDEEMADFDVVSPAWDNEVNLANEFDSEVDADGDLNGNLASGHDGWGIEVTFDDANAAYGVMNADAVDQTSGVFSFWFDPNDVAIESGKRLDHVIAYSGVPAGVIYLELYNNAGTLQIRAGYKDDAPANINSSWVTINMDYTKYTVMFAMSTGVGNDDGYLKLYMDDVIIVNLTGLDNDTQDWDNVRFGMVWTNSTTFGGSFYMDTIKIDPVGAPHIDKLAAKNGTYGMTVIKTTSNDARRVEFDNPNSETAAMAECWFNPNSVTMGEGDAFVIMSASPDTEWELYLKYTAAAGYQMALGVTTDVASPWTSYYSITDDWHHIRVYVRTSTGAGDDNGSAALYIDYVLQEELTGLDNDTVTCSDIFFGFCEDLDDTTYGIMYFDDCKWGPWEDISADVMHNKTFSHSQGINGTRPTSLVASPGKFTFFLNNRVENSKGLAGYYSPDHTDARAGFEKGTEVRVLYTCSGTQEYFWRGKISDIVPDASPYKAFTKVTAYDWMKEAGTQKFKATEVATDQRGDQALTTMADLLPTARQPSARSFDTGKSTFPYVFDSERDEKSSILSVCQKIAQSELGKIYINHQSGDGEQLTFENRHHAIDETTVQHDFDDNVVSVSPAYKADLVKTKIIASAHPRRVDTGDVILGQLQKSFQVQPSATQAVTLAFRDPDGSERVSASSLAARVSGTDYIANADEDGGGADRTSDLTVTENTVSGNAITLDCENTGTSSFWVTTLQQKGKGLYLYDPVTYEAVDGSTGLAQYGEHILRYDLPYEDDYNEAVSFGDYLLSVWKDPVCQISGLSYYPEESATLTTAFLAIDIGHRITVNFTQLGIDEDYFVSKISVRLDRGKLRCSYNVVPAGSSVYMQLDDAIYAKLDEPECKLAF